MISQTLVINSSSRRFKGGWNLWVLTAPHTSCRRSSIGASSGRRGETSLIFTIPLWENIVVDFFGRKVELLPDIQFNGLNIYTYNRGYLINKVYFSTTWRVRANKINLIKNNPFILWYSTCISSPTPAVIYSNLESEKSLIYADNRDKSGIYLWINKING